jgi:hypothetical protein
VQGPGRAMLADQFLDQFPQGVPVPLACHRSYDTACRIDEYQGGPGADGVSLPDQELGVIDDRMRDLVAPDGVTEGGRLALVGKFGRVYPDDGQGIGERGFQRLQLREDVQAVDSAVRPEIEQDHASTQVREAERTWGVEPLHTLGKLGRVDRWAGASCQD